MTTPALGGVANFRTARIRYFGNHFVEKSRDFQDTVSVDRGSRKAATGAAAQASKQSWWESLPLAV